MRRSLRLATAVRTPVRPVRAALPWRMPMPARGGFHDSDISSVEESAGLRSRRSRVRVPHVAPLDSSVGKSIGLINRESRVRFPLQQLLVTQCFNRAQAHNGTAPCLSQATAQCSARPCGAGSGCPAGAAYSRWERSKEGQSVPTRAPVPTREGFHRDHRIARPARVRGGSTFFKAATGPPPKTGRTTRTQQSQGENPCCICSGPNGS